MGGIHLGHASLIKRSINQCNKTLVSIFINKPQFDRKSDFKKYPRVLKKDIYKLKRLKVDLLYLPNIKQIYTKKDITYANVHKHMRKYINIWGRAKNGVHKNQASGHS